MNGNLLATLICLSSLLAEGSVAWAADTSPAGPTLGAMHHPDSMRYFVLDESRTGLGTRSTTYIDLIGHQDSKRFLLYYEGKIIGLAPTHHARSLRVFLRARGKIVSEAVVRDLTNDRGTVAINTRFMVDSEVTLQDVEAVDARIGR